MSDQIITYSMVHMNPAAPKQEDIHIKDIAHALSLMTRAGGHFPEFYSVGQHCIACAREALTAGLSMRTALACLLHDASEAYLADITRPVKHNLPKYLEIEEVLQNLIYEKYLVSPLSEHEALEVKRIDDTLLYYEFSHYMGVYFQATAPVILSEPEFVTKPFQEVEQEYLHLYQEIVAQL